MGKRRVWILCILLLCIMVSGCNKKGDRETSQGVSVTPAATAVPTTVPTATVAAIPTTAPTPTPVIVSIANTMTKDNFPVIDGSTATIPLSEAVYQVATGASKEEAASVIVHTKTTNAYNRLMKGDADLLIVYEPSEEVKKEMAKYEIDMKPVGRDALVFMANTSNPVQSLTNQQIIDIYSGKLKNWAEVGGVNKEIIAFQRPDNSGSQTLMQKLVMKDIPMMKGPNVISFETMEGILKAMADYDNEGNTLGYSVFYYAKNMYQLPELRFMKVDGIEPTLKTIYDKTYPYINDFYAVIMKDAPSDSNARRIFDWLTGEEGQQLIKDLGYVPVNMEIDGSSDQANVSTDNELPENFKYITASYATEDGLRRGTVTVYDSSWKAVQVFRNAYVNGNIGLVPDDYLLPIGVATRQNDGSYKMKYGLYNLKDKEYVLTADYDSIDALDEGRGYYIVDQSGTDKVIDVHGKVLASGFYQGEGLGIFKKGDYYWLEEYPMDTNKDTISIFDKNFTLIKRFVRDYEKGEMYEVDGTVLFSRDKFVKKYGIKDSPGNEISPQWYYNGEEIYGVTYNGTAMVFDRNMNKIAEKYIGDNYQEYYNTYEHVFSDVAYDSKTHNVNEIFYDKNGKLLKDKNRDYYTNIVGSNYYQNALNREEILYNIRNHKINILNYNTGKRFELDTGDCDKITVDSLFGDLIVVVDADHNKTKIYKGNQVIKELKGQYSIFTREYGNYSGNLLLYMYNYIDQYDSSNSYIMFKKDGEMLYQSKVPENILTLDDNYIQLSRGDYFGVIDYAGNYIVKSIKEDLGSD